MKDCVSAQAHHEVDPILANVWLLVAHGEVGGAPHAVANIVDLVLARSIKYIANHSRDVILSHMVIAKAPVLIRINPRKPAHHYPDHL